MHQFFTEALSFICNYFCFYDYLFLIVFLNRLVLFVKVNVLVFFCMQICTQRASVTYIYVYMQVGNSIIRLHNL